MYLDQKHNNCKYNLGNLCQKVNTNGAKLEIPIHLGHKNQYWLEKEKEICKASSHQYQYAILNTIHTINMFHLKICI